MLRAWIRFTRNRRGAAGAEFALLALVFAGVLLGVIDFGRALWEYNSARKACQAGARFAVANNMIPTDLMDYDGLAGASTLNPGDPIPVGTFPTPIVCNASGCTPDEGYESAAYNAIYDVMAGQYPQLGSSANRNTDAIVEVTYTHVGRGFAGNPYGPDVWPVTTVSIRGLQFEFTTPLIGAVVPFEFPRCSATLYAEDYQTCTDGNQQPPCT
jgi:Flp pilus assembly pilin Flp